LSSTGASIYTTAASGQRTARAALSANRKTTRRRTVNVYETNISVLTATPGMAEDSRRDAVEDPNESQHPWWRRALRTQAGRKVLAELNISITPEGGLPADWEAHPLTEPNDGRLEAALSVTVAAMRAAVRAPAGVVFLERHGASPGRSGPRNELHLCAIDAAGMRAALMPVC
jgi:hypothetical protein